MTTARASGVTNRELITATIMNAHVRDQLTALKTPAYGFTYVDEAADYTTTSTSFVDVDATDLAITIVTGGGTLIIGFTGSVYNATANTIIYFDVDIDGTRVGLDDGLTIWYADNRDSVSFTCLKSGLSAASHVIKLQWKTSGGTATLYAGAGTATYDVHPFFWVRELA